MTAVTGLIAVGAGSAAVICPTGLANKTAIINSIRIEQDGMRKSVRSEVALRNAYELAPLKNATGAPGHSLPTQQRKRHALRLVKSTTWVAKTLTPPCPRGLSFDDVTPPSYVELVHHERWGYATRAVCATSRANVSRS